ncbi:MAG: MATE family efflux transporter [Candidatus Muiribacteriota bacterium]
MKKVDILNGKVTDVIFKLALPMVFGVLSIVLFHVVDTFFVGRLGTLQLAAISYVFPVMMVVGSLSMGLGVGAGAVISKAYGKNDIKESRLISTSVFLLALILAVIISIGGLFTINPLFKMLGAGGEVLKYIHDYMFIWYIGLIFKVVPMITNNLIRAIGDTKSPALIMTVAGLLNMVLDPVFIFGFWVIPAMGIKGAALATVLSRVITLFVALYILIIREKLIIFQYIPLIKIWNSWKQILYIGIPETFTRVVMPFATGVITRMLSVYGPQAVAGFGVASRLEFFALIPIYSVVSVTPPFIGQNLGACNFNRIKEYIKVSRIFSIVCSIISFFIFYLTGEKLVGLFNPDPEVIRIGYNYLLIVSAGYGFYGIVMVTSSALNVFNKPFIASFLNILQMILLYIPLAYIISYFLGINGIFASRFLAFLITSLISIKVIKKTIPQ